MTKIELAYIREQLKSQMLNTAMLNVGVHSNNIGELLTEIANRDIPRWLDEISEELEVNA